MEGDAIQMPSSVWFGAQLIGNRAVTVYWSIQHVDPTGMCKCFATKVSSLHFVHARPRSLSHGHRLRAESRAEAQLILENVEDAPKAVHLVDFFRLELNTELLLERENQIKV